MRCPLCGGDGVLIFTFHCNNADCQNYDKENAAKEVLQFPYAPMVEVGDRVKMRQYDSATRMDQEEAEYLKKYPGLYSYPILAYSDYPRCIADNGGWLTVQEVVQVPGMSPDWNHSGQASRAFSVTEYTRTDIALWTSIWVEEVKKS